VVEPVPAFRLLDENIVVIVRKAAQYTIQARNTFKATNGLETYNGLHQGCVLVRILHPKANERCCKLPLPTIPRVRGTPVVSHALAQRLQVSVDYLNRAPVLQFIGGRILH